MSAENNETLDVALGVSFNALWLEVADLEANQRASLIDLTRALHDVLDANRERIAIVCVRRGSAYLRSLLRGYLADAASIARAIASSARTGGSERRHALLIARRLDALGFALSASTERVRARNDDENAKPC